VLTATVLRPDALPAAAARTADLLLI